MMKKIILSIIALLALITTASASSSLTLGSPSYSSSVLKDESFTVSTSLEAASVSSTITVTVTLTDNTGALSITSAQKTLTFSSDGTQNIQWSVKANNPGTYSNPFTITATATDGGTATKTATTSLSIKDRPVLDVNVSQDATTVSSGESVKLNYIFKNIASAGAASATNINASITVPSGWTLMTPSQYNIDSLAAGAQSSGYFIVEATSSSTSTTFNLAITSAEGDSISKSWSVAVQTNSGSSGSGGSGGSGGGGSGGGGGGGASGENYTNIQAKESREEFISKDIPITYNFTTPELPVYGIVITGNTNAGLIAAQVELLKNTSTFVKEAPPGTVYKNVNIWVGTAGFATPKNIKEAIIKFKVENSWITSGGFKDAEIVMLRWDGTQWVKLETQPKNKDDNFTYFEAETTSFSPYVITGLKGEAISTATPAAEITQSEVTATNSAEIPAPGVTKKTTPGFGAAMTVFATALLVAIWNRRKR